MRGLAAVALAVVALAGCDREQEQTPRTGFTVEFVQPNATCAPVTASGTAGDGTLMTCGSDGRWHEAVRDR